MRVSAETRSATRTRILEVAQQLFAREGFDAATTRDIAREAEIAAGTLFNYFPSKEAIVACLAEESLANAHRDLGPHAAKGGSFEEELFTLVALTLRKLKTYRPYLPVILETVLSPLALPTEQSAQGFRLLHLQNVGVLARRHGLEELSSLDLQLYWSLFTGLLFFWAKDPSPRQEDTLALLDSSLEMFVDWLKRRSAPSPANARKK